MLGVTGGGGGLGARSHLCVHQRYRYVAIGGHTGQASTETGHLERRSRILVTWRGGGVGEWSPAEGDQERAIHLAKESTEAWGTLDVTIGLGTGHQEGRPLAEEAGRAGQGVGSRMIMTLLLMFLYYYYRR